MRRILAGLILSAALVWGSSAQAAPSDLTLKRVMLSSGGVGYFEYETEVDGGATLGLDIPLDEIDDVLKSLVVFDSSGGVGSIELPGKDDSTAAFGDIPIEPSALGSPMAYLNGLKGTEVTVTGPHEMTGKILQAESVLTEVPSRDGAAPAQVPRTRVSLLTADGLRQFILEDADAVQVTDPKLRAGIGRALDELRRSSSHDKRHVTLHVAGTDHRTVRVGYVVGAPLWKTTYRLVLPESGKDTARLQAWAVLENQSGVDWNGIELTLQSGNPVTFRQALYQSYFVTRPEVPVEVFNHILPPEDTRASASYSLQAAAQFDAPTPRAPPPPFVPPPEFARAKAVKSGEIGMAAPEAAAEATEAAEAVIFRLPKPVILTAGHSASVPLLDREAKAATIDLATDGRTHPLAAVKLTNDTGSGLPPGVLTLYAPGAAAFFAGDARIGSLPAGETRLLSFAEDLHTTLEWHEPEARTLVQLTAASGVLKVEEKTRTSRTITLIAPATAPQRLLLAIDKPENAVLGVEGGVPDGTEETASAWRLPYALKPGETRQVKTHIDTDSHSEIKLTPDAADRIIAYATSDGLSAEARAALQHLIALQQAVSASDANRQRIENATRTVEGDEARTRQNLQAVLPSEALHSRLTKQLEADEDKLAGVLREKDDALAAAEKARHDLADAVTALRI